MSAHTHYHDDLTTTKPRQIDDIERHLRSLNILIEGKYHELSEAQRRRIARLPLPTPLRLLRRQLAELADQFDLAIAEHDRRRI